MRRSAVLVLAATVGLLALGAAPASAVDPRVVPETDTLYAIACPYYSNQTVSAMQLTRVDTSSATASSHVGTGTPALTGVDCAGQGAWNAATSTAYAIAARNEAGTTALVTVDADSGVSTLVGEFAVAGVPLFIQNIAISADGRAYAGSDRAFYSLDLATGGLTTIADFGSFNAMSFDPTSDVLYAVSTSGAVFSVRESDGTRTPFGQISTAGLYSFAIDSAGIFWFGNDVSDENGYATELVSVDPANIGTSRESAGIVTAGSSRTYSMSLLMVPSAPTATPTPDPTADPAPAPDPAPAAELTPAPQLAATGTAPNGVVAIVAAAIAMVGIALLTRRRTQSARP